MKKSNVFENINYSSKENKDENNTVLGSSTIKIYKDILDNIEKKSVSFKAICYPYSYFQLEDFKKKNNR